MKKEKVFSDEGWICDDCAIKREWWIPEDACNTVTFGTCWHCKQPKVMLTPVCDFKGKNKTPVWD